MKTTKCKGCERTVVPERQILAEKTGWILAFGRPKKRRTVRYVERCPKCGAIISEGVKDRPA